MDQDNLSNLSTVALISDLTDGDWRMAYTALLDLTGAFRNLWNNEQPQVRIQALDLVAELQLAGHTSDAKNLLHLTSDCEHPALAVLMQCSRTSQGRPPSRKSAFYMSPSIVENTNDSLSILGKRGTAWPDNMASLESVAQIVNSNNIVPRQVELDTDDCIENAARFAQEEHRLWLLSNLRKDVENPPAQHDNLCKETKFSNLFKQKHKRAFAYGFVRSKSIVGSGQVSAIPPHDSQSHDDAFLEHLFNTCITGSHESQHYTALLNLCDERAPPPVARKDSSLRRQASSARRKKVRDFIASRKLQRGEVYDSKTRAAMCGNVYQDVLSFAEVHSGAGSGRVFEAVAEYAFDVSREYFCALFESAFAKDMPTKCRPWLTLEVAESYLSSLVCLASLLADIERTDRSACAILNKLFDAGSQYSENRIYRDLFTRAFSPYAASIRDWVLDGSLRRDIAGEFFGFGLGIEVTASENLDRHNSNTLCDEELHSGSFVPQLLEAEDALFILRAGRSRELAKRYMNIETDTLHQEYVASSCGVLLSSEDRSDVLNDNTANVVQANWSTGHEGHLSGGGMSFMSNDMNISTSQSSMATEHPITRAKSAHHGICFPVPVVPSASDVQGDRKLLLFSQISTEFLVKDASILPGAAKKLRSDSFVPLTITQCAKALLSPLRPLDEAVQKKVTKYFIEELGVFEHLRNLRAHVLLGAGDFANILVDQIDATARMSQENEKYIERRANAALTFYGTSGPGVRANRDQTHLNRCLHMALNLYSKENGDFARFLSLDAAEDDMSKRISLWEVSIEVKYKVPYPLTLLFSPEVLSMYSKIFNLMLRVLRAKKSLRSLFMMSRRKSALRRRAQTRCLSSAELRCVLWDFCWQAEHFVTMFGGFQMDQVLGSAWNSFESSWEDSNTIWELRDSHVHYLNDCMRRCLLDVSHKSVLGVMREGLDIVVNVDNEISSAIEESYVLAGKSARDTVDLLRSSSASLRRRAAFLHDVLKRLLDEGMSSHLEDLLVRLSFGSQDSHGHLNPMATS